jgi:hypothetical protein
MVLANGNIAETHFFLRKMPLKGWEGAFRKKPEKLLVFEIPVY